MGCFAAHRVRNLVLTELLSSEDKINFEPVWFAEQTFLVVCGEIRMINLPLYNPKGWVEAEVSFRFNLF